MVRGDDKKQGLFGAFLNGLNGNRPSNPGQPRPRPAFGQRPPPPPKRPCNCTGKRRTP